MIPPTEPVDEAFRIRALRSLGLLDPSDTEDFDNIVKIGRSLFNVPICLISLVDSDMQWFKAAVGLDARETPRKISFCGHAILHRSVFIVPDATQDERFQDNPLVTGGPRIRFYAGAPLWLASGYPIGTLCVISPEPRNDFSTDDTEMLARLAGTVMSAISVRSLRRKLDRCRIRLGSSGMKLDGLPVPFAFLDPDGRIEEYNDAFLALCVPEMPDGLSATEALAVDPALWNPKMMDGTNRRKTTIRLPLADVELHVHPRVGGFLISG
jgi:hypothetical protein